MHSDRQGHGQKSVLPTGASENNGTGFLRASSKSRGCFRAFVLSSLDTFVSTIIVMTLCALLYMNFTQFYLYRIFAPPLSLLSPLSSPLQMLEERISNRDSSCHVGGLLGQLFNGSFSLVSLSRYNVRLRGRCDCPGSANGRNVIAFQFTGHVHGWERYT